MAKNNFRLLLFLLAFILLAVVDKAEAQGNTDQIVVENSQEAVTVEDRSWFKIEQLSGEVNQGDFVVGPGRAEIEVKPGQTITYEISVSNRISDDRTFNLVVEDMVGSPDGESAVTLLGDAVGPHTVRDFIKLPKNSFNLKLGERARIPVTISIPPDAEPGGYYGSVLVSTIRSTSEAGNGGTSAQSPVIARIGTLFFITVPGEVKKDGRFTDFLLVNNQTWFEKGPIKMNLVFENNGSVHLNPYGEIRVKNFFGEEVGMTELEPWFVLPESVRSRPVDFDRELLLGRYVATAYVNRGYDDVVDEKTVVFWVMPWKIVAGTFLIIFAVIFAITAFFRRFELKRKD